MAKGKRSFPLRRVIDHHARTKEQGVTIPAVKLECGHLLAPPEDRSGRRYPERMRCHKCAKDDRHAH